MGSVLEWGRSLNGVGPWKCAFFLLDLIWRILIVNATPFIGIHVKQVNDFSVEIPCCLRCMGFFDGENHLAGKTESRRRTHDRGQSLDLSIFSYFFISFAPSLLF